MRAGRALNATLDLQEILLTLVHEAALALDADLTGVYLGDAEKGAVATAGYGVPEGWHGLRIAGRRGRHRAGARDRRDVRPATTTPTADLAARR